MKDIFKNILVIAITAFTLTLLYFGFMMIIGGFIQIFKNL